MALVSAPLTKALEITFLTGFATAYKLESLTSLRGGLTGLPGWERKKRQKLRQKGSAKLLRVIYLDQAFALKPCYNLKSGT